MNSFFDLWRVTQGSFRSMLRGIALVLMLVVGPNAHAEPYPWESPTAECQHSSSAGKWSCTVSHKPWTSIELNLVPLQALLRRADFKLIGRAEQDLAYSRERLDDGEFRAELWMLAIDQYFGFIPQAERLAASWEAELGTESFACYVQAMVAKGAADRAYNDGHSSAPGEFALQVHRQQMTLANELLDSCPEKVKRTLPWHHAKVQMSYLLPALFEQQQAILRSAADAWPDAVSTYLPAVRIGAFPDRARYAQVESVARMAVEESGSSMRTALYARLYSKAFSGDKRALIVHSDVNWEDLKASFRDVEAQPGFPHWIPGDFAALACAMNDRLEARHQLLLAERVRTVRYPNFVLPESDPCVSFAFADED